MPRLPFESQNNWLQKQPFRGEIAQLSFVIQGLYRSFACACVPSRSSRFDGLRVGFAYICNRARASAFESGSFSVACAWVLQNRCFYRARASSRSFRFDGLHVGFAHFCNRARACAFKNDSFSTACAVVLEIPSPFRYGISYRRTCTCAAVPEQ